MTLQNKYVCGTHVMWYEIEMYEEFINGLINTLKDVDNPENVYLDFCFNMSEHLEEMSDDMPDGLLVRFHDGIRKLKKVGNFNIAHNVVQTEDGFYYHADYRRDLNANYCNKVDFIMHGETDSFFPGEALEALETLKAYTNENNIHRYTVCFADRKMWDSSWDATVHPDYIDHVFEDGPEAHLNPMQAKSQMSIEAMNKINEATKDGFEFTYINYPKIDGSCLVVSADLVQFGVNIPRCLIYNDDHGFSIMATKLCGENYVQFICKNLLKVHARRHPQKRMYVKGENNPHSLGKKQDKFERFKQLSDANIQILQTKAPNRFFTLDDFNK